MTITKTYEPIRSLYAPDNYSPYVNREVLGGIIFIDYGSAAWPSRSYWIVPGTINLNSKWV